MIDTQNRANAVPSGKDYMFDVMRQKLKNWQSLGIEPGAPGLSCQCSIYHGL